MCYISNYMFVCIDVNLLIQHIFFWFLSNPIFTFSITHNQTIYTIEMLLCFFFEKSKKISFHF